MKFHVGVTNDTGGALGDVTDEARSCRTTATFIWGVSDPLFFKRGTSTGGWQRGSLTPQVSRSLPRPVALTATRVAQKRRPPRRGEVAHWQGHRSIDLQSTTFTSPRFSTESRAPSRGNTAPQSVFPLFFHDRSQTIRNQGDEMRVMEASGVAVMKDLASP
jgi:hypothetical protein